jgi:polyhydroxybutyrate depolymerase
MIRASILLAVALSVALLAGCGNDDGGGGGEPKGPSGTPAATATPDESPTPAAQTCAPARPHAAGGFERDIESGGLERAYLLHVPRGYDGTRETPVILAFHGFNSNKEQLVAYSGLSRVADEHGFILVAPDGVRVPTIWHMVEGAPVDDVGFTLDVLAEVQAELCTDEQRIFAAGHSNGGGMALFLACQHPELVAGVGVVSAIFPLCDAPVRMIAFHGTEDTIVPFEGGDPPLGPDIGVRFPPIRQGASNWARGLGCDGLPLISRPSPEIELSTFVNCPAGDGLVLLYTVLGGGHTWPGGLPIPFGHTTNEVDASERMWEFFSGG